MAATQRGEATKLRWADCEIIAHHFNAAFGTTLGHQITKHVVHRWLYNSIVAAGILDGVKAGERVEIDKIPHLEGWAKYVEYKNTGTISMPRVFSPKREEKLETPAEKLKVAMWFIAKFETPDAALRALKAGIAAMQELSDGD